MTHLEIKTQLVRLPPDFPTMPPEGKGESLRLAFDEALAVVNKEIDEMQRAHNRCEVMGHQVSWFGPHAVLTVLIRVYPTI